MKTSRVDRVVSLDALPALLVDLVRETVPDVLPAESAAGEAESVEADMNGQSVQSATPSPYACPDCSGVLWQVQDGPMLRLVCRVGHSYTVKTLLDAQAEAAEDALWVALRTLEENVAFARRMAQQADQRGRAESAEDLLARAAQAEQYAETVRGLLNGLRENGPGSAAEGEAPVGGEGL